MVDVVVGVVEGVSVLDPGAAPAASIVVVGALATADRASAPLGAVRAKPVPSAHSPDMFDRCAPKLGMKLAPR